MALEVVELEVQVLHQIVKTDMQVEMVKQMILEVQHQAHLILHSQVAEVEVEQTLMEHQVVQELEALVVEVEEEVLMVQHLAQQDQLILVVVVVLVEKMQMEQLVDLVKLL